MDGLPFQPTPYGIDLPVPPHDRLLIVPLGGCDMVGMNATLYGLAGAWLLVDYGLGFGAPGLVDLDAQIPDPRPLVALGDRLIGCVLTHGHEDHMGALRAAWPHLKCPIMAPAFAASMLDIRFRRAGILHAVELLAFDPGENFQVGPFRIQTLPVPHSTPDCVLLAFDTPAGTVVHSGDWKLDPSPGIGVPADIDGYRRLGDRGVRLIVGESTNAATPGRAGSEADVMPALELICRETPGQVVVASFASHLARIRSAAIAGARAGRWVAVTGNAMLRAIEAGAACGYVEDPEAFLTPESMAGLPKRRRLLITTGVQGEPNAGLRRMLDGQGDAACLSVGGGDSLVLAGRVIPGREVDVTAIKTMARRLGVTVWTADTALVHVSGHACQDDFREMYELLRPAAVLPVHGGRPQLADHAAFIRACGVTAIEQHGDGTIYEVTRDSIVARGRLTLQRWGYSANAGEVRVEPLMAA